MVIIQIVLLMLLFGRYAFKPMWPAGINLTGYEMLHCWSGKRMTFKKIGKSYSN